MENTKTIPQMMTIEKAAKFANLTKYHTRQLVLQGKVKFVKSGVKYLVNVDSLIEYLNNGEPQTEVEKQDNNTSKIRKVGI